MAKNLPFTPADDTTLTGAVLSVDKPSFTLGSLVAAVLAAAATAVKAFVDPVARTVDVRTAATPIEGEVGAVLMPDTEDRNTTFSAGEEPSELLAPLIDVAVAPVKPRRSVASLLSALEDRLAELRAVPGHSETLDTLRFVVDQSGNGTVSLVFGAEPAAEGPETLGLFTQDAAPSDEEPEALPFE